MTSTWINNGEGSFASYKNAGFNTVTTNSLMLRNNAVNVVTATFVANNVANESVNVDVLIIDMGVLVYLYIPPFEITPDVGDDASEVVATGLIPGNLRPLYATQIIKQATGFDGNSSLRGVVVNTDGNVAIDLSPTGDNKAEINQGFTVSWVRGNP